MRRRRFLAAGGAASLVKPAYAQSLPVPPGNAISFKILRNGTPVGEHFLNFTRKGEDLTVEIHIRLKVAFAGIPVFGYHASATERWSGGVFQSLDSAVNHNGTHLEVHAHKVAGGYAVVGVNHSNPAKSYPAYTAPPDTLPLTYWNKAILQATVLNIETAHSYPVIVRSPGWNSLPTANGGHLEAQRFNITGKLHLSVWYDRMAQWSGLEFHVNGDETYEKIIS